MNKKVVGIIAIAIVLLLLVAIPYADMFLIVGNRMVNMDPQINEQLMWLPYNSQMTAKGYIHNDQIMSGDYYIKSWLPGGNSEPIYLKTQGAKPCMDGFEFYTPGVLPWVTEWWWNITVFDLSENKWITIADEFGVNPVYSSYFTSQEDMGPQPWDKSLLGTGECGCIDLFLESTNGPPSLENWYRLLGYATLEDQDGHCILLSDQNQIQFNGPCDDWDYIQVSMNSLLWWYDAPGGTGYVPHTVEMEWVYEFAQLVRGECTIQIDPGPHGGRIYEEGETVEIDISTDYAGKVSGDIGKWRVTIYNPDGIAAGDGDGSIESGEIRLLHPDGSISDGRFIINDLAGGGTTSLNEYTVKWTIPTGTYDQYTSGSDWEAVIENTLYSIEKEDNEWFAVREGMAKTGPINVIVDCHNADTDDNFREITCTATGNPAGDNKVSYFNVKAYRDGYKYWEEDWIADLIYGGNTYESSGSVPVTFDSKLLDIDVRAFDARTPPMPSIEEGEYSEYINNGGPQLYALNFLVNYNGEPIQGAVITIGGNIHITDAAGSKSIALPGNQYYDTVVTYHGDTKTRSIYLIDNGQTETFNLGMSTELIISILIIVIIMVLAIIMAVVIPIHIAFRIMIIMVGAMVSVFVYLIMNGYIL